MTIFGSALPGPSGYFAEGMPLAYLLATVITGLGLLIGSLVPVSHPEQVARSAAPASVVEPKAELVGRITGTVDCKGEKKGLGLGDSGLVNKSHVALGDRFALSSGLMEITYNTGAKVILQGPATYEAESDGGYLSAGRLTGKLEKKGGPSVHPSSFILHPSANPQSLIPNPFVIRTPTATVTDLGTEFGVEANGLDATKVYVFDGAVNIARPNERTSETIHAGDAVEVGAGKVRRLELGETPQQFVRTMRPHVGPVLLADDFNDNSLDLRKWRTDTSLAAGHARVIERNHRMELANRGHLITRKQYFPDDLGGIEITGRWTFAKGQNRFLEILTRADGIPNKEFYDETTNGLDFMLFAQGATPTKLEIRAWGFCGMSLDHLVQTGAVVVHEGDAFTFKVVDCGASGLSFTLTQVGNPSNTASATAVLTANSFGYGHVVFHNCQFEGQDEVTYLNDVAIMAPATLPTDKAAEDVAKMQTTTEKPAPAKSSRKEKKP